MLSMLTASRGDGTYNKALKELVSIDLLIIDEIGFKKVPQDAVDEFFEDWANVFGDQVLASAIIDRLVHHCHIIKIIGPSYRMKNLKEKTPK